MSAELASSTLPAEARLEREIYSDGKDAESNSPIGAELDILPLPTDFDIIDDEEAPITSPIDPTVMTEGILVQGTVLPTEGQRLTTQDMSGQGVRSGAVAAGDSVENKKSRIAAVDLEAPSTEGLRDPSMVYQPQTTLDSVLSSLEQKAAEPVKSAASSPLSSLPDLPTQYPLSPRLLASVAVKTGSRRNADQAIPRAESSSQAAKRAKKEVAAPRAKKIKTGASLDFAKGDLAGRKAKPANKGNGATTPATQALGGEVTDGVSQGEISITERARRPAAKAAERKLRPVEVDELASDMDEEDIMTHSAEGINGTGRSAAGRVAIKPTRPMNGKKTVVGKVEKVKAAPGGKTRQKIITDAQLQANAVGKKLETQHGSCLRARYAPWGKCVQCVAKTGGDSCRFRDFRVFPLDPARGTIIGPGYFEPAEMPEPPTPLPTAFNVPLEETHITRTEQTVAPVLLPLITRELRHIVQMNAVRRGVDAAKHRSVCDFCSSTIFAGYFFCRKCGRDYCLSCERFFSDERETITQSPWYLPDQSRPRLQRCTQEIVGPPGDSSSGEAPPQQRTAASGSSNGITPARKAVGPVYHFRGDLQPVSRFSEDGLRSHWLSLAQLSLNGHQTNWEQLFGFGPEQAAKLSEEIELFRATRPSDNKSAVSRLSASEIQSLYTIETHSTAPLPLDPADLRAQSLKFVRIQVGQLDNQAFDQIWARGEPIVVDGVRDRLQMQWTPDELIANFGAEPCGITDCERNTTWGATVRDFFEDFKNPEGRPKGVLKLKDWPATEDFKSTHPGLYNDFCDALPVPDYTRREGVMNLYAHFPPGPTRPDIGPKMYNAFAAKEESGGHGSTRLHMDVADAINVMLYASDRPSSSTRPNEAKVEPTEPDGDIALASSTQPLEAATDDLAPPVAASDVQEMEPVEVVAAPLKDPTILPPETDTGAAEPGCAVWDIFRAEDANKIRQYLSERYDTTQIFTDPIHSQLFFLDSKMRKELWDRHGVVSWRIYQYPGQAVFIPAGCAHQVCNLADCIKIALDFVSPHNVPRCQQLMQDFREENFLKAWKEDVLQLQNILWFAWLSAREARQRRQAEKERKEAERIKTLADIHAEQELGTGMMSRRTVSSVRDDPRNGSRPPTPPTTETAQPNTEPLDPAVKLTQDLLEAALAAPDPAPPPDARPASSHARKLGPKVKLPGIIGNTSTGANVEIKQPKASDAFRTGQLPLEFATDLILHGLSQGENVDQNIGDPGQESSTGQ